jgi:hypothetical protein
MKEEKENNACENKIYSDSVSDYLEGMWGMIVDQL